MDDTTQEYIHDTKHKYIHHATQEYIHHTTQMNTWQKHDTYAYDTTQGCIYDSTTINELHNQNI